MSVHQYHQIAGIMEKYVCLQGCNLSDCCLKQTRRKDLSYANRECAQFVSLLGLCANLESVHLKSCNLEDPIGVRTNLQGMNLKGTCLEGCNMAGVNLRVANLKNANMKNCVLRSAFLPDAYLERCNLSRSNLRDRNLRGANLKDAKLKLTMPPLHILQRNRKTEL